MGLSNLRKSFSTLLTTDWIRVVREKEEDKLVSLPNLAAAIGQNFVLPVTQTLTGDGAITVKNGLVILNKAGAIAATLADPTATTDDGKFLIVLSVTAQAHTVTIAGGLNGAGAGADVGTFAATIGSSFTIIAYQGKWYRFGSHIGVTWA